MEPDPEFFDITPEGAGYSAKAKPPLRTRDAVRRQRLLDILQRNLDSRVQVLSAPAGYGKTTLLADFVNDLEVPVCWYSLDESDRDPRLFIDGLSFAVNARFADFHPQNSTAISPAIEMEKYTANLVNAFINQFTARIIEYTVFVIEDYNFVEDSPLLQAAFDALLTGMPNNCHFVISSRSSIELPSLSRLVVQRKANCLNIDDMGFTPIEAKDMLSSYFHLDLSDTEAEKLVSETDGWIVGIILKANKILDYSPDIGPSAPLSKENVFDFLLSEVYAKQTPGMQDFLLTSSILDVIDPNICNQLFKPGKARSFLNSIIRNQLFIQRIDSEKPCYRYHHVFREFLQQKLLEEDSTRFRRLHAAAATIYQQARQHIKAVQHYLSASQYDKVVDIINSYGEELLDAGKWTTLLNWINAMPGDSYAQQPHIKMLHARSLVYAGEANVAIGIFNELLNGLPPDNEQLFKARILSWRSAAYRLIGYITEAKKDINAAIAILEANGGPDLDTGDAYRRLGEILLERGSYKKSIKELRRSLKHYTALLNIDRISNVHNSLGVVYRYIGNLTAANMHFEKARIGWQKAGNDGALSMTLNNIAEVYFLQGNYELALYTLQLGLEKTRQSGYRRIEACILIDTAEVKSSLGQYLEAIDSYNQGLELARQVMETYYIAWAKAGLADTYRLLGDIDRAETLAREAISIAEESHHDCDIMQFRIQIGILEYVRGNYRQAIQTLNEVVNRLQTMGDKNALAKAYLHLAQAYFMARNYDQALEHLQSLMDLCGQLGYYDFVAIEGRNSIPLLQLGISSNIGGDTLHRVLDKVRQFHKKAGEDFCRDAGIASYSARPDIEVHSLGEIKVVTYGSISDSQWRSNKAKELFVYLLCTNKGRTSEQIAAALWPDMSPAKAIGNFHVNLHRARRAVLPNLFVLEEGKYRINRDLGIWFDVAEFEKETRLAFASRGEEGLRAASLEKAIELYHGDFMDGFFSEWVEDYRRELEDKYIRALSMLSRIKSKNSEYDNAIELMLKAIKVNQYNEEAYRQIIEWQMTKGDRTSAITTYNRYLDQIVREMDIAPSPMMESLRQRIFKEDKKFREKV